MVPRRLCTAALLLAVALNVAAAAAYEYEKPGPYFYAAQPVVTKTFDIAGCTSSLCKAELNVTLPLDAMANGKVPLAVFTNGFQLHDDQYVSYANHLASWGWAVVRWNIPESAISSVSHVTRAHLVSAIIDWVEAQHGDTVRTDDVYALGHSLGGKSSIMAAIYDARIKTAFGVDPVNCPPPFSQFSDANPDATLSMPSLGSRVAIGYIGSEYGPVPTLGIPCASDTCNYAVLYNATVGPSWSGEALGAGHMQFMDDKTKAGITASLCKAGASTEDAIARSLAHTLTAAWGQRYIFGVAGVAEKYFATGAGVVSYASDRVAAGQLAGVRSKGL